MTYNQLERNFLFKNCELLEKIMCENQILNSSEERNIEMNIRLAGQLLDMERQKDPANRDVWIASTRLKVACGNIEEAKKMFMLGCEYLRNDEKLWLEAVDLHEQDPTAVRNIIERAIELNSTSANLWLRAANVETDENIRRQVFREAFKQNFCAPADLNFGRDRFLFGVFSIWPHEETKNVLNDLSAEFPCDERLCLALARFEGLTGNVDDDNDDDDKKIKFNLVKYIDQALITFADNDYAINNRDEWIKEAIIAEGIYSKSSGVAIMKAVMSAFKDDSSSSWIDVADYCISRNACECAYAIYDFLFHAFPSKAKTLLCIMFNDDSLDFTEGVNLNEKVLHSLIHAKINWTIGIYEDARRYFIKAFKEFPAFRTILKNVFLRFSYDDNCCRDESAGSSLWRIISHAEDAWRLNQPETALKILREHHNAEDFALWKLKGQIEEQIQDFESAKQSFETAIGLKADDIQSWLLLSKLEENRGNLPEARKVLVRGRKSVQVQEDTLKVLFLLATVRLEQRAGNNNVAQEILRGLLENFRSSLMALGLIWIEVIIMEPRQTMGEKAIKALEECKDHRYVILEVAKFLFNKGKVKKSRKWFEKIVTKWPRFGDAWAYFYKLENIWGEAKKVEDIKRRFVSSPTSYFGAVWFEYKEKFENRCLSDEDLLHEIAINVTFPGTESTVVNPPEKALTSSTYSKIPKPCKIRFYKQ